MAMVVKMQNNLHAFLILGLPEAGKTSFILAVDDLLQNPPTQLSLRSFGLAEDRGYLERFKAAYRKGEKLKHTERNLQGPPPELWFEDPSDGQRGRLFLPDTSGEVFQDQWVDRVWSKAYRESLAGISGILMFVRADMPSSNQEMLGEMAALPANNGKTIPWDPKKASQQVQLVEVLQFIAMNDKAPKPLKIALLISAWDTVLKPDNRQPKEPGLFLKREWSLLEQYLRTNASRFTSRVYGVSALGGTEKELETLSELPPHERVQIADGNELSRNLTLPLQWLMKREG